MAGSTATIIGRQHDATTHRVRSSDREVPLGHQEQDARVLAPAVHAWLDGELPEASVRKGDTARDVEFWKHINVEVDQRRHMRTPTYLEARIMEAIPQTAPQAHHAVVAS